MTLRPLVAVLLLGLLTAEPALAETPPTPSLSKVTESLEREIRRILDETGVPSISLALVRDGKVAWSGAYGFANVGARVPATTDTYYNTGSTFKFVTATAVMRLAEQGKLTLDTPLNQIVGSELAIEGADDVTLRHLLSHTSGLDAFAVARRPRHDAGPVTTVPLWSRLAPFSLRDLLAHTRRRGPPGVEHSYCNDCYGIAGYVVERVSGTSYDGYVAEHVLRPLGVEIDRPSVPAPRVVEHLALPYGLDGNESRPLPQVRYDAFPAGDAYLRATDMARFVAAQLNDGEYDGKRILSEASARELRRRQFDFRPYGLGVGLADVDGRDVLHHGGGIPGYTARLMADPAAGVGVYIMANAGEVQALGPLARHAMRLLWGDDPDPLPSFAGRTEVAIDPGTFDAYVGEYELTPVLKISVTREGGRFFVQPIGRSRVEIFPVSESEFFMQRGGTTIVFGRDDDDGPVTHLILRQGGADRRADRVR